MLQQIFDFIKGLSDKAFRSFVTLAIVGLGWYGWRIDSKLTSLATSNETAHQIAALQTELAVKEQRIQSLERQVQAQWQRNRYWHGDTDPAVRKP